MTLDELITLRAALATCAIEGNELAEELLKETDDEIFLKKCIEYRLLEANQNGNEI